VQTAMHERKRTPTLHMMNRSMPILCTTMWELYAG
jgi:hypothetical protein